MKILGSNFEAELEDDEVIRLANVFGNVEHTRHIFLSGPSIGGGPFNDSLHAGLELAKQVQDSIIGDASRYQTDRGNVTKWSVGSLARIYIVFPPYPVRISPVEVFEFPAMASVIFPAGSEIHLDLLAGGITDDVLFDFPGAIGTEAACMRRDIVRPIIKAPELPITVFNFRPPITNLSLHNPVIYGAHEAVRLGGWNTDTRIHGGHFEKCGFGLVGEGGHNCHIYDNSWLTCETAIRLVNAQSMHIRGNVFSQENSVQLPSVSTAIRVQGKNLVIDGNSIRDHTQNFSGNIYGGSFTNNTITYSPGYADRLDYGWLAWVQNYNQTLGGTDWKSHAKIGPKCTVECNRVWFDEDTKTAPDPAIVFAQGVRVDQVMNRGPQGEWLKSKQFNI